MEKNQQTEPSRKKMLWNSFLGGIAAGLGATIGVSILLAIFGLIAGYVGIVPIIGTFVSDITTFVLNHNPKLQ